MMAPRLNISSRPWWSRRPVPAFNLQRWIHAPSRIPKEMEPTAIDRHVDVRKPRASADRHPCADSACPAWGRFARPWSVAITSLRRSVGSPDGSTASPAGSWVGSSWQPASSSSDRVLSGSPYLISSPDSDDLQVFGSIPQAVVEHRPGSLTGIPMMHLFERTDPRHGTRKRLFLRCVGTLPTMAPLAFKCCSHWCSHREFG